LNRQNEALTGNHQLPNHPITQLRNSRCSIIRWLLAVAIMGLAIIIRITPRNIAFSSKSAKLTEMAIPVINANIAFRFSISASP
jgi:hypothetical protein